MLPMLALLTTASHRRDGSPPCVVGPTLPATTRPAPAACRRPRWRTPTPPWPRWPRPHRPGGRGTGPPGRPRSQSQSRRSWSTPMSPPALAKVLSGQRCATLIAPLCMATSGHITRRDLLGLGPGACPFAWGEHHALVLDDMIPRPRPVPAPGVDCQEGVAHSGLIATIGRR